MTFRKFSSRLSFLPLGLVVALVICSAESRLFAQLKWDATTTHQELTLGQETAEAEFTFENKGTYPVIIRSTSSSCGCTTAKLERSTYYPGDKGMILTRFDVGSRTGARRNTVQVVTDDPTAPSTTLTFSVEIPSLVTITPRLLHWRTGEAAEEKVVRVQLHPESGLELKGVEVESETFEAVLVEREKPGEFDIRITPLETKSPERVIISLQTEPEVENRHNFSFYAYVR